MTINPYLNRKPTRSPEEFFGRRADVTWLLERLTHPYSPQCCSITGLRRIGKSSLLRFLADPEGALRRFPEFAAGLNEPLMMIYLDVSLDSDQPEAGRGEAVAVATLSHMLRALSRQSRAVGIERTLPTVSAGADSFEAGEALDEALYLVRDEGYRIVFLLDEVDVAGSWSERLAATLRAYVMEHNITYVTASLLPLHELLEEKQGSVLYNMFTTRSLGLLEQEEARALLVEPAARQDVHWPDGLADRLLPLLGGHPDLIKIAGSHLWELTHRRGETPSVPLVLHDLRPDARALFRSIWDHLDAEERQMVISLASGRRVDAESSLLPALQQRAIVVGGQDGAFSLLGELFAEWVRDQPEARAALGGPTLDGRYLLIDGNRTLLTPTEARLARALLARRGRTVPRDTLQEAVWNQVDPASKALDTTIQRLREKIEKDRANPQWLVTVRGEGYLFN